MLRVSYHVIPGVLFGAQPAPISFLLPHRVIIVLRHASPIVSISLSFHVRVDVQELKERQLRGYVVRRKTFQDDKSLVPELGWERKLW